MTHLNNMPDKPKVSPKLFHPFLLQILLRIYLGDIDADIYHESSLSDCG